MIRVQKEDFSLEREYQALLKSQVTGAVVTFIGTVRDFEPNLASTAQSFFLQHYPGMTEAALERVEREARARWKILNSVIIHRVGELSVDDQIVLVGASSAHRDEAFAAVQFMIDVLKTEAPFWKKEGENWVQAKASDQIKTERWLKDAKR